MSKKISVIFFSVLIFWLIFAPKSVIIPDATVSRWITSFINLFMMCCVLPGLKQAFTGPNKTFNLLFLAYFAVSVFSVYYNADTISKFELSSLNNKMEELPEGVTSINYLFIYFIGIFASSLYIQGIAGTKHIRTLLKTFFFLFVAVLIPVDIEACTIPIKIAIYTEYTVGNKFTIGYFHIYFCAVFCLLYPYLNSKIQKILLLSFVSLMVFISIVTQSSTMVLGAFIFLASSLFLSETLRNYFASPKVVLASILLLNIGFFFFVTWILQYDFVQYFIKDVLHEDMTLTGRLQIYIDIQKAFTESPWIGLGYGNSVVVSKYFTDAYDSQNGLIELFIQIGAIGVVLFLSLLYTASKAWEKNDIPKLTFLAFVYTMIGIATVEIPYKHTFVFFLTFCFIQGRGYPKSLLKQ